MQLLRRFQRMIGTRMPPNHFGQNRSGLNSSGFGAQSNADRGAVRLSTSAARRLLTRYFPPITGVALDDLGKARCRRIQPQRLFQNPPGVVERIEVRKRRLMAVVAPEYAIDFFDELCF